MRTSSWTCVPALLVLIFSGEPRLQAATLAVPAGGDLQKAINNAQPGDTILLEAGAEFVGNFVLPVKTGEGYITIRSSTPDSSLPGPGQRITPAHAPLLARLRSASDVPALRTDPGAHHWRLQYLEFAANKAGYGDIIRLGDGSSKQNSLALVPYQFILEHVYVHGDPLLGQKRGIAANVAHLVLRDSHISDIMAVGQDTQAIGAYNGPGPFLLENNYLEAAGENVLFGGADPYITNLVAEDIVIRRNLFSRPMSWKDPIIPTPQGVTAATAGGGSLAAGTYAYRIVARRPVGQATIGRSTASGEVSATVGAGGAVTIRWQAVPNATEYRVYGRTVGSQSMFWKVTGTEFTDTGAAGTSEAVPTSGGTLWTVKNLFELKNARNVLVEANIFENHWKQAQPGYALVYTPRNSGGTCTWCIVEQVTFQYNLIRNVSAGFNILGYDNTDPSGQANNLIFRHNLFLLTKALGGNGWFMQIGDEPRDVTIENNTIDSDGSAVVSVYGGTSTDPREVYGFRMLNNASRHGNYGMSGAHFAYGNEILKNYYPGNVFLSNYLAGASASRYPAGTLVSGLFPDQFVDPAGGDYTVRAGSILQGGGTDGRDVGVDFAALMAAISGVESGTSGVPSLPSKEAPVAAFSYTCNGLTCSFADGSTDGDGFISQWSWTFSDGAASTLEDPTHTFSASGTYVVSLTVTDNDGVSSTASHSVTVKASNVAPVAGFTVSCVDLSCTFVDASSDADGSIAGWQWTFGDGSSSTVEHPTKIYAAAGTYTVVLTVVDNEGASASASATVTVSASNVAPTADFTFSCSDLTCAFTSTSTDTDGSITSWHWTFGAAGSGSAAANPSYTFPAAGTYDVVLTVADDRGATASVTKAVTVTSSPAVTVHVGDIDGVVVKGKGSWWAKVTIRAHTSGEQTVAGAVVSFYWNELSTSGSCTTTSTGQCTAQSPSLPLSMSSVKLTVQGISSTVGSYNSSHNHDPDGDSNGTALRITRK